MTTVYKDIRNSWQAEDFVPLDATRQLYVLTMKRSGGMIVTTVKAVIKEGDTTIFNPFEDYSDTLISSPLRCTAKNVALVHGSMMGYMDQVTAEALAFYAKKNRPLPK